MTSKIRLHQLECFRALARTGSFGKAAKLLGVTAPAVHQHITNLQNSMEGPPFFGEILYEVVDGHHLRITPYGNDLLLLADAVIHPIEQFEKQSLDRKDRIIINIASLESVCTYGLPEIVEKLQQNYPSVLVRILSRPHAEIPCLVSGGDVDMGIMQEANLPDDLLFREWRRFDTVLMVPFNHPISMMPTVCLEMLSREPLILQRTVSPASSRIRDRLRNVGIDKATVETTSYECAKQCVARRLGIAFASAIGITDEDRRRFRVIPVSNIVGEHVYGVVLRRKQSLSSPLKLLLGVMGIECHDCNMQ